MEYTKQQKIDAICEVRGFEGTNDKKLAFIQDTVVPEIESELINNRAKIEKQIAILQSELAGIPATALQAINKRAIYVLRQKETETLTANIGEL